MLQLPRQKVTHALLILASGFGIACGGESTAPQGADANVNGTWVVTATERGNRISCEFRDFIFVLNQTGQTFSGTYTAPAEILCTEAGGRVIFVGEPGSIVNGLVLTGEGGNITNGRVSGPQVSFELKTANASLTGSQLGDAMSGTGADRIEFADPIGTIEMTLTWGAHRQ